MDGFESKSHHPLRMSLFPKYPPYIRMLTFGDIYDPPLPKEMSCYIWNAPTGISPIIVNTVTSAGYSITQGSVRMKENDQTGTIWDCLPITEKAKDEINYKEMNYEVKINQFPGLFSIGRKDHLWINYERMRAKFGGEYFNFIPETYILPRDKEDLISEMKKRQGKPWILKPPNWFCGIGISLINSIAEIPEKRNLFCVQEYIDRPFLIKGLKFDLRLYVLLTNLDPIRLYVYEEGLVRFATKEYTNNPDEIKNNFIHLTNFSVNKNNDEFVYTTNPGKYDGHKWNLKTLWKYFDEELKIDWRPVWEETKDICMKTVLCGHEHLSREYNRLIRSDYCCYKLFGFDVFFDSDLKPWILEVNNIPSLHVNEIDAFVNLPMVSEMFNIVGLHLSRDIGKSQRILEEKLSLPKQPIGTIGCNYKLYTRIKTEREKNKILNYSQISVEDGRTTILNDLTPADIRTLVQTEDEFSQTRNWTRLLPATKEIEYLPYLSKPDYNDRLLEAWIQKYGRSEKAREEGVQLLQDLCQQGKHLHD